MNLSIKKQNDDDICSDFLEMFNTENPIQPEQKTNFKKRLPCYWLSRMDPHIRRLSVTLFVSATILAANVWATINGVITIQP